MNLALIHFLNSSKNGKEDQVEVTYTGKSLKSQDNYFVIDTWQGNKQTVLHHLFQKKPSHSQQCKEIFCTLEKWFILLTITRFRFVKYRFHLYIFTVYSDFLNSNWSYVYLIAGRKAK